MIFYIVKLAFYPLTTCKRYLRCICGETRPLVWPGESCSLVAEGTQNRHKMLQTRTNFWMLKQDKFRLEIKSKCCSSGDGH